MNCCRAQQIFLFQVSTRSNSSGSPIDRVCASDYSPRCVLCGKACEADRSTRLSHLFLAEGGCTLSWIREDPGQANRLSDTLYLSDLNGWWGFIRADDLCNVSVAETGFYHQSCVSGLQSLLSRPLLPFSIQIQRHPSIHRPVHCFRSGFHRLDAARIFLVSHPPWSPVRPTTSTSSRIRSPLSRLRSGPRRYGLCPRPYVVQLPWTHVPTYTIVGLIN